MVNNDPDVRGKLRVEFLPNYSVTLAERLIPASDVSEQISTAGYEASGTSNMKFMMNGALTVGTRDGATIEIAEEAGEENVFLFGLTAEQVAGSRGWYDPRWHYEHEDETRQALDLIFSGHFNRGEPGALRPDPGRPARPGRLLHAPGRPGVLRRDPVARVRPLRGPAGSGAGRPILNVARSGKFSSDRTIAEYAGIDLGGDAMSCRLAEGVPDLGEDNRRGTSDLIDLPLFGGIQDDQRVASGTTAGILAPRAGPRLSMTGSGRVGMPAKRHRSTDGASRLTPPSAPFRPESCAIKAIESKHSWERPR